MNAFSENYEPQINWRKHDTSNVSRNGQKAASQKSARFSLPGSLRGVIPMIDIPSRQSINTDTTAQRDRTDKIRRGGR
jgi:hypothetical protein